LDSSTSEVRERKEVGNLSVHHKVKARWLGSPDRKREIGPQRAYRGSSTGATGVAKEGEIRIDMRDRSKKITRTMEAKKKF